MNTPQKPPASRDRGRPREFDTDLALDSAMLVFRQKGYHAASIADLSEAMGLTAGSIYKAFKDKRTLFQTVFERYIYHRGKDLRDRLDRYTSGREKLAELLQFYLDSAREVEGRRGCLVVGSAVGLQVFDDELAGQIRQAVLRNKSFLTSLIRLGQEDGSIAAEIAAGTAAGLILCMIFGMRVVGKIEDNPDESDTIQMALKILN
ncbi:TetR family transcriptional regulator (plasmid) [Erwinia sp. E602]|uniref:TetR/AcrR family transcriptional regulator n=1 Tax=Erwinia sp. E602 TaxID=2675378 RepID=UPI001BAA8FD9|nr:TetR family transcriptional regulator [Erwinia sp. E602]